MAAQAALHRGALDRDARRRSCTSASSRAAASPIRTDRDGRAYRDAPRARARPALVADCLRDAQALPARARARALLGARARARLSESPSSRCALRPPTRATPMPSIAREAATNEGGTRLLLALERVARGAARGGEGCCRTLILSMTESAEDVLAALRCARTRRSGTTPRRASRSTSSRSSNAASARREPRDLARAARRPVVPRARHPARRAGDHGRLQRLRQRGGPARGERRAAPRRKRRCPRSPPQPACACASSTAEARRSRAAEVPRSRPSSRFRAGAWTAATRPPSRAKRSTTSTGAPSWRCAPSSSSSAARSCTRSTPQESLAGSDEHRYFELFEELAEVGRRVYRALVWENPRFAEFFFAATPLEEIAQLPIGSRPSKRQAGGLEALRAIPGSSPGRKRGPSSRLGTAWAARSPRSVTDGRPGAFSRWRSAGRSFARCSTTSRWSSPRPTSPSRRATPSSPTCAPRRGVADHRRGAREDHAVGEDAHQEPRGARAQPHAQAIDPAAQPLRRPAEPRSRSSSVETKRAGHEDAARPLLLTVNEIAAGMRNTG